MSEIDAYHEAGHALWAVCQGARVRLVTLEPEPDDVAPRSAESQVEWPLDGFTRRELAHRQIQVALAGPAAEMLHTGEPYHPGFVAAWSEDWRVAWKIAEVLVADDRERLRFLEFQVAELHRQLGRDDLWAALAAIVDELLAHETVEGTQIEEIVRYWLA